MRSLSQGTVVDVSIFEGQRVATKQLLGETRKLKKLFVQKKVAYKAWLAYKSSLKLHLQYSEALRQQPQELSCLMKGYGRNLEKGWIMISKG